ncbi:MAG: S8 family serine peptidase, partial [Euryarchaeota archaeon]|nr:S8 family serine peptidase [Euryarchaeota archaeon]
MECKNVKTKVLAAAICVVFFVATSGTGAASYPEVLMGKEQPHTPVATEYAPGEILVKFKPYVNVVAGTMTNYRQGTFVVSTLPSGTQKLKIPPGETVEGMVNRYNKLYNVEYAEPNYVVHAQMVPNDPGYQYQWHYDNDEYGGINMECAWNMSTGTDVVVAVLDTGVAYENYSEYCEAPDLKGTTFVQGYDFINMDAHPNDDHYHGTHVTGTVAQTTNDETGVAGVAFNCKIMPVKVLNKTGSGTHSHVAEGIYYATDNDTDVISMSLAGPDSSTTLKDAVAYAYNNNVTVIACAGNNYEKENLPQYPAAYDDYVIAVGATIYNETRAGYSNTGTYLDLAAPGGNLSLDQNGDGQPDGVLQQSFARGYPCTFTYYLAQGTSMATPHVSGVAALLIANGVTGPDNVREILESTAED